jgi:hypothetical protein
MTCPTMICRKRTRATQKNRVAGRMNLPTTGAVIIRMRRIGLGTVITPAETGDPIVL